MTPNDILELWRDIHARSLSDTQRVSFLAKVEPFRPELDLVPRPFVDAALKDSPKLDVALPSALRSYELHRESDRLRQRQKTEQERARQRRYAAEAPPPPAAPGPTDLVWATATGAAVHCRPDCPTLVANGKIAPLARIAYGFSKPERFDCHICINGLCKRCCADDHRGCDPNASGLSACRCGCVESRTSWSGGRPT